MVLTVVVACSSIPSVSHPEGTPRDLEVLAADVFTEFLEAFPAQHACLGDVEVSGARVLEERAEYHPSERSISLRIPATAPHLRNALLHELGHHIAASCESQQSIRSDFIAAQGLDGVSDWFEAESWEATPSELFAEAVVEYVAGERTTHTNVFITDEAVDVIEGWAIGG